jgi:orotate phosphoribosyltransferase
MLRTNDTVRRTRSVSGDALKVLELCGGLYICPKTDGQRVGPLVAYRGTYGSGKKRYVGDLYANCAKVEQWPIIAHELAVQLLTRLATKVTSDIDAFCGAPEGGKHLADKLALWESARYIYPEKKGEELAWGRHEVQAGDRVVIVEDVANNFTTTEKLVQLIQKAGGTPVAIATYLNRSPTVRDTYTSPGGLALPICALVSEPYPEYEQDHPEVADDIANGNIIWDVKGSWPQLVSAMRKESTPE